MRVNRCEMKNSEEDDLHEQIELEARVRIF
jgi:hypothetical protein